MEFFLVFIVGLIDRVVIGCLNREVFCGVKLYEFVIILCEGK